MKNAMLFIPVVIFGGILLAGCGRITQPVATAHPNSHHASQAPQSPPTTNQVNSITASSLPSSTSANAVPSLSPSSSPSSTSTQTTQSSSPPITLENSQVTDNSLILYTTHGTMQTAYSDPHIILGTPNIFEMTLVNTSAGKFPVNVSEPILSNWGISETLIPQGHNLLLKLILKPQIHQFQIGIGGGDIIQITFSPSITSTNSATPPFVGIISQHFVGSNGPEAIPNGVISALPNHLTFSSSEYPLVEGFSGQLKGHSFILDFYRNPTGIFMAPVRYPF
ncbi:hypothetical protein Sulac_0759 [Sulfobacillus acidophilus DSM 10332]|uniref:Uncharacterized protein n=1 Tax=Sulfobacillus acidophilus (strain ATCC 700253 / DSM 10332 / NAL) TaxID=679936 RepID=G8U133_SULAD|nr:hypothetical protein Sulac_0759 [Sulfobacillus acidophilus DSM 10332]